MVLITFTSNIQPLRLPPPSVTAPLLLPLLLSSRHFPSPVILPASAESGAALNGLVRKGRGILDLHVARVKCGRSHRVNINSPLVLPGFAG